VDGLFPLRGGALAGERLLQARIECSLRLPHEPLMLLEEDPQPGVVMLAEEVRHERAPDDAIVEQRPG
jgi:hypothetical protein